MKLGQQMTIFTLMIVSCLVQVSLMVVQVF
jgi:hypothetical protein